jgi:hypothetical protein
MTTQTDDTRRILDMLQDGKITVDEADRLLKALSESKAGQTGSAGQAGEAEAAADGADRVRWIRINIQKPADEDHKAKNVNIRVPIAIVKGGMRLGAIIGTFAGDKAARRMKADGLDIDVAKISSDLSKMNGPEFDEFLRSLNETNIEIDDGKSTVRITAE